MGAPKRVLVTGASGFIGRALCKRLVDQGFLVRAVIRPGGDEPVQGVSYVALDLETTTDVQDLVRDVCYVVHLAGRAHGKGGKAEQTLQSFVKSNVDPTRALAEAAATAKACRFVLLSSIGVHGDKSEGQPLREDSELKPHANYAESKVLAEQALQDALADQETSYAIIRPTLVYGVNAPGNFARLIKACRSPIMLPLGMATNRRSFVSVNSLIDLIVLCMEQKAAKNQVYVAADKYPVSTKDLIVSIRSGMNKRPGVFPFPRTLARSTFLLLGKRPIYQQLFGDLVVDAGKAVRELGWQNVANTLDEVKRLGREEVSL